MTDIQIPKDSTFVSRSVKLQNVNEWFCPNCGTHGDDRDIDRVVEPGWEDDGYSWGEYCCGQCFEPGIYVTFNK